MPQELKLCSGCRFFNPDTDQCEHSSAFIPDFVRGEHRFYSAQTHRQWTGKNDCTPSARHYEERESAEVVIYPAMRRLP